jgi:hypothetical protein
MAWSPDSQRQIIGDRDSGPATTPNPAVPRNLIRQRGARGSASEEARAGLPRGLRLIRLGGAPPLAERVQVAAAERQFFRSVLRVCEAVLAFGIDGAIGSQAVRQFAQSAICRP